MANIESKEEERSVELMVHPDVWSNDAELRRLTSVAADIPLADIQKAEVARKSIDARRGKVRLRLKVRYWLQGDELPEKKAFAPVDLPNMSEEPEVAIIGAGPAGMFAAWQLAMSGIRCIVLERGKKVRARRRDLAALMRHGDLNPESNYCFGEGGAGTFSDGKLYTRAKKRGDYRNILEAFVAYGAAEEILVDARPHIGTNKLPGVIGAMREHLESAGVIFEFEAKVSEIRAHDGKTKGMTLADGRQIDARAVIVAAGHSARDVFEMSHRAGAKVEFKPFALGVRVEHSQAFIDKCQFGELAGHPALGAAAYRLVENVEGVGVFSFCMRPGGFIAPAATEIGGQVVNGWSPSSRSGRYANSGFVAEVGANTIAAVGLDPESPFCGVDFQRMIEIRAYMAGGRNYVAPAQRVVDMLAGKTSSSLPETSYQRGVKSARLDEILGPLASPISQALAIVDKNMPGFAGRDSIALGVESRTSSPVRINRERDCQSPTLKGFYPCGEGAGFAGGIMSAALDGIRVARAIVSV